MPCLDIKLVDRDMLQANNYNPNNVPKDKMELLKQSIIDNGFCFPIVTIWAEDDEKYIIVDGFHRYTMKYQRVFGKLLLLTFYIAYFSSILTKLLFQDYFCSLHDTL